MSKDSNTRHELNCYVTFIFTKKKENLVIVCYAHLC